MTNPIFIPNEDPDLPKTYCISITYVNGKDEIIEAATHRLIDNTKVFMGVDAENNPMFQYGIAPVPFLEIWKKDDTLMTIPLTSISSITCDKNYTKILEKSKKS